MPHARKPTGLGGDCRTTPIGSRKRPDRTSTHGACAALIALIALTAGLAAGPKLATAALSAHARSGSGRSMSVAPATRAAVRTSGEQPCAVLPPEDAGSLRFGERVAAAGPWLAISTPTSGDDAGSAGEVVVGRLIDTRRMTELDRGLTPGDTRPIPSSRRLPTPPPTAPSASPSPSAAPPGAADAAAAKPVTEPTPPSRRSDSGSHDHCVRFDAIARLRSHASFDHFGSALGLGLIRSAHGPEPLLLVGRDQAEANGAAAGAVDVYRPAQRGPGEGIDFRDWMLEATLEAASPQAGAEFGASISLATGDPSIAVIGAPRADVLGHFDAGSIEVFRRDIIRKAPPPLEPSSMRPPGTAARAQRGAGDSRGSSGSHADAPTEARWRRIASIRSSDPQPSGWFGRSVATDGRWLAVGAPGTDVDIGGSIVYSAGTVFLYRIDPDAIVPLTSIVAPAPSRSMWFGASLAIDEGRLLVGAPGAELADGTPSADEGVRCGLAYLYDLASLADDFDSDPVVLEPHVIEAGSGFGQSVALAPTHAVVGAPGLDGARIDADGTVTTIEDAGSAALFELPWRGAMHTGGALVPSRILEGPSTRPMSLFANVATFAELHSGGLLTAIHGHLYVEEEAHGPSPGVTVHRVH